MKRIPTFRVRVKKKEMPGMSFELTGFDTYYIYLDAPLNFELGQMVTIKREKGFDILKDHRIFKAIQEIKKYARVMRKAYVQGIKYGQTNTRLLTRSEKEKSGSMIVTFG